MILVQEWPIGSFLLIFTLFYPLNYIFLRFKTNKLLIFVVEFFFFFFFHILYQIGLLLMVLVQKWPMESFLLIFTLFYPLNYIFLRFKTNKLLIFLVGLAIFFFFQILDLLVCCWIFFFSFCLKRPK